jgi:hypothetical protein
MKCGIIERQNLRQPTRPIASLVSRMRLSSEHSIDYDVAGGVFT